MNLQSPNAWETQLLYLPPNWASFILVSFDLRSDLHDLTIIYSLTYLPLFHLYKAPNHPIIQLPFTLLPGINYRQTNWQQTRINKKWTYCLVRLYQTFPSWRIHSLPSQNWPYPAYKISILRLVTTVTQIIYQSSTFSSVRFSKTNVLCSRIACKYYYKKYIKKKKKDLGRYIDLSFHSFLGILLLSILILIFYNNLKNT